HERHEREKVGDVYLLNPRRPGDGAGPAAGDDSGRPGSRRCPEMTRCGIRRRQAVAVLSMLTVVWLCIGIPGGRWIPAAYGRSTSGDMPSEGLSPEWGGHLRLRGGL